MPRKSPNFAPLRLLYSERNEIGFISPRIKMAAFAAAVAIHVSALAFTPVHRSETFGSDDFPVVGFEPSPPEPSPEPEDNQLTVTTTPPLLESNEYTEEARPTPRRISSPAHPIHSSF